MKSELQTASKIFMEWYKENMLSLTLSQSEIILFFNGRLPTDNCRLKIDGYNISLKGNITCLGLLLNGKLNRTTGQHRVKMSQGETVHFHDS